VDERENGTARIGSSRMWFYRGVDEPVGGVRRTRPMSNSIIYLVVIRGRLSQG
jgi:hypothetical protein